MREKLKPTHQRDGNSPGAGPLTLGWIIFVLLLFSPIAIPISVIIVKLTKGLKGLIKQVIPEAKVTAGYSLVIMFVIVLLIGYGAYIYTCTHTAYEDISPLSLQIIMVDIIVITGFYGIYRCISEKNK